MDTGVNKKLIIIVVAVIVVAAIALIVLNSKPKMHYSVGRSNTMHDNTLISNKDEFDKFVKKVGTQEALKRNYKNVTLSEQYNGEYFQKNKLAVITVYEDDSREYLFDVENVTYSSDKTQATISYVYKEDTYIGTLGNTWYETILVELPASVTSVNYVNTAK